MTDYIKPALPEIVLRANAHYAGEWLAETVEAYADACVAAYKAHIRAEQGKPAAWTDARLRGIASDYFSNSKDWPAAMLCMRHLLMEQAAHAEHKPAEPLTLSDEQIAAIERECYVNGALPFETRNRFARAVLAAAQEKTE
jgi:hypothetical protein